MVDGEVEKSFKRTYSFPLIKQCSAVKWRALPIERQKFPPFFRHFVSLSVSDSAEPGKRIGNHILKDSLWDRLRTVSRNSNHAGPVPCDAEPIREQQRNSTLGRFSFCSSIRWHCSEWSNGVSLNLPWWNVEQVNASAWGNTIESEIRVESVMSLLPNEK